MPKVSVVMPVHNTKEEYLRESIGSILNQTFTDFEFIIIDDSTTNAQENVIKNFNDERINYQKLESLSLADALNYGINLAKGQYIARMDADDISLPTRFEKQVNFLETNIDYSVIGSWFEIFPKQSIVKHIEMPKILDFFGECCIGHPTVMFRKADFDKYNLRYENKYYCEDYDLWSRAVRYLNFYNIQEVLLYYRDNGENRSHENNEQVVKDSENIRNNILNILKTDENLPPKIKNLIIQYPLPKLTLLQKIFSIRCEFSSRKLYKVIRILGLKISIKEEI